MKSFFSKKLYWEGIKKVKVIGIAFAAISTILCAMIPGISMLEWYSSPVEHRYTTTVTAMEFSIPAYFIMIVASIILVLSMFSYLNKRSESDFYHAIPYKRSCVYISFMAAVLSWLVLTALLSVAAAAFFCWIHPGMTVGASIVLTNLGILILLGFTIAATVVVAMTLTGTTISNLLITTLLLCFVPVVGLLFITVLSEVAPLLYIPLTPIRLLQPEFSLPIAIFEVMMMGYEDSILFNNSPMVIYTVIVTVLMLVAGCLLYMFRKSEMASKSAPNKFLQHVYRCAVSLPFALFAAMFILIDGDFASFIVLAVITLLIYYAYELITTKRFKNLLKATPFIGVLIAGCLVFVGGIQLTKALTLSYSPDADDIVSIGQLEDANYGYYDEETYEDIQTQGIEINTPEAFEIVSAALKDSINRTKDGVFYGLYDYEYKYGYDYDYNYTTVKITDKSGKVCGRQLRISSSDLQRLSNLFLESPDYAEALLKMPADSEVQSIDDYGYWGVILSEKEHETLWKSLIEEYNGLTREQQLAYKSTVGDYYGDIYYPGDVYVEEWTDGEEIKLPEYSTPIDLEVRGTIGTKTFCSTYSVRSDLFPKTCALYAELLNSTVSDEEYYGYYGRESYTFGPTNLQEYIPLIESDRIDYFSLNIDSDYFEYDKDYSEYKLSAEKLTELRAMVEYVLNNPASAADADYYVMIDFNITLDDYSVSHANRSLIGVSAETYQTLCQMINDYYAE